jgi:hypothetical protein
MGAKILFGIPSMEEYPYFLVSMNDLIKQCRGKYTVSVLWEKWQKLDVAQNKIVEYYLANDFDYLIFFDDDHWGHTVEMVDALIDCGALMATIKSYCRHPPYPSSLYALDAGQIPRGVEKDAGRETVDLTGFPMTLLRRELFTKIERPFFIGHNFGDARNWSTDGLFCQRLCNVGIKPMGIFDHCLNHREITKENIIEYRKKQYEKHGECEEYVVHEIIQQSRRAKLLKGA